MSHRVEELVALQEANFENLKSICSNFGKDGGARKQKLPYLEERFERLRGAWEAFVETDELLKKTGQEDIQYFTDDVFNKTKVMYDNVLQDIINRISTLSSSSKESRPPRESPTKDAKPRFNFDDVEFTVPPPQTSETEEKLQELLRQQYCNFKGFERAVERIDFETPMEKWELEDNLTIIKAKWSQIEKSNWELEYILQDEDSAYKQKYAVVENIYDSIRKALQNKIWNNAHYEKATPKIVIPDFYGDYNKWLTFKDLYMESVHRNPLLSKAQKMQHLKSKLKGDAEKLVQHLGISAENYSSCWDIITHRYDNGRLLFTSYMNTLLNQPAIQQANAASIRKLHDVMLECLNGLTNIGLDITTWDPIVVHLLVQKLDSVTYNEYMKDLKEPRGFPNLQEFTQFLESKFMSLETLQGGHSSNKSYMNKHQTTYNYKQPSHVMPVTSRNNYKNNAPTRSANFNKSQMMHRSHFTTARTCPLCKTDHVLMQCQKFLNMNGNTRLETVRNLHVCKNCLYSHEDKQCTSRKRCKLCYKQHHTLMHEAETDVANKRMITYEKQAESSHAVNNLTNDEKEVLLTTVQLKAKTVNGDYIKLRGLLDQGSQVSLITEDAAQRLRLPRRKLSAVVSGVGSLSGNCKGSINIECKSIHSDYTFNIETLVMRKLINNLPTTSFSIENWHYLENLKLADPHFNLSGPIDLLLGADVYSELILNGVMKSDNNYPVAQQTRVGWILCGNVKTFKCCVTLNDIENMTRFWESEEIGDSSLTNDHDYCEKHYTTYTERKTDGKYVVQMPMKPEYEDRLGATKPQAQAQFLQLEKKMQRNEEFKTEYKRFMNEYMTMGHMKPAIKDKKDRVYLPHHGVLKSESTTTKLRVVFNASYKTKTNQSLNDLMYTGPNLQKDMLTLLINWRVYKYVFTADVEKMYRNIWLHEQQQNLQTIIWRSSPQEPLQEWQLCTVTYGTKAAPYLAMRTLHQLAQDERDNHPDAAHVLENYFYMDDLVYGQDTVQAAKNMIKELVELLKKGGFNLRKWTSNDSIILSELNDDQKFKTTTIKFNPEQSTTSKTLGLRWNPATDNFTFNWNLPEKKKLTKRFFLGEISKLYDPLGWLAPATIKAKLMFQKVWISKINWDESLPEEIASEWETMRKELPYVNKLKIPRWLQSTDDHIEIHGFCDASEKAYACVVYSRVKKANNGNYVTTLIAAKTKVAPLSKKITLPRMELSGALLLAKLIEKLTSTLTGKTLHIHCWCDSKVVLAWIQGNVNRWERYIANRVTKINDIIPATQWHYVKSEENSADCATRGLSPSQLLSFTLWWEGPEWLKTYKEEQIQNKTSYTTNEGTETKCCVTKTENATCEIINTLLNKYSNLKRVTRVLAWALRFIRHNRDKNNSTGYDKQTKEVLTLTLPEISTATNMIIKIVQQQHFNEEMERLKKNMPVSTKSSVLKLTPYLDEEGLLRVKGRLANSTLPLAAKHPIILPATGKLTELIIQEAHNDTLHGGARLTLAYLRERFWIIGGSKTVKKQLRQCIKCHRFKPHRNEQLMADLPKERVTPTRPFTNTGVDFTGHVDIKINKGRGVKTCKAYVAIFICMVTKAVHLELVSDLSTQTFLAAFKRMCSRRGTPKNMFSDNGTNFVGAAKVLQIDFERNKTFQTSEFYDEMTNLKVQWHFNAPFWPTAGGLWEAAVKAMKYHLKRVLGEQKLTFEQFTTLLTQIEACLNSRPLCPLSEDIDDLEYISPGHFLIGGPLLSLPQEEENFSEHDLRNRWRLVEQMNLHIWKRWSAEYLHQLQVRSKWQQPKKDLEKGNLVLVKEEYLPPGKWALGRITEVHPGADGKVRVATLKTKKGELTRPITKLVPLPQKENLQTKEQENLTTNDEEKHRKQRPTRIYTGRKKYSLLTLLLILLTTTSAVQSKQNNMFQVTPINEDHPIYFDEAGKVQLIHDEWTLLVYYNLTSYWEANTKINNYVGEIDKLCHRISYTPCNTMVNHLQHELYHLTEYNTMLLSQHLKRVKRGYFDAVGKLAGTLFGVLDVDFAAKYENDIKNLRQNDDYLLQLIKNQTLIIEAENNIVKKGEQFMEKQFDTLHTYIKQTYSEIDKIENRVQTLYAVNDVNSAAITSTLILSDLQRIQEMLINALSDIFKGHLDSHLLPASQLIDQLNIISGNLPQGLSLPIKDVHQDIQQIFELIYVRARITEGYLLFELHIPLLSDDEYTVYRMIPLPFMKQGRRKLVRPSSNFIAINFVKNLYYNIEQADMQQCTKYAEEKFSCLARQPVYNLYDKDAPCEANVFSQQSALTCVIEDVPCKEKWVKLHKPNLWLYTLCNKQLMRVICDDQVTPTTINGTGVIALKPKCVLQKKDATLFTYNHLGNNLYLGVDFDVPTVNSTINNMFKLNWDNAQLNMTEVRVSRAEEMESLEKSLNYQKQRENLPGWSDSISVHDVYHYAVSTLLLGGILFLALYFYIKTRCSKTNTERRKQKNNDIEMQQVHAPAQSEHLCNEVKPKRKTFQFDEL